MSIATAQGIVKELWLGPRHFHVRCNGGLSRTKVSGFGKALGWVLEVLVRWGLGVALRKKIVWKMGMPWAAEGLPHWEDSTVGPGRVIMPQQLSDVAETCG